MALYNATTKKGLFLALYDNGNTDGLTLSVVDGTTGKLTKQLTTVFLGSKILENKEYWLALVVQMFEDDTFYVGGIVADSNGMYAQSNFWGKLSDFGLQSQGQIGIGAWAKSAVVDSSVTNFQWYPIEI